MKSKTTKQVLFAILLIVFGYIWWGNIRLFMQSDDEQVSFFDEPVTTTQTASRAVASIDFKPYKVNPFVPTFGQPSQPTTTTKKQTVAPQITKLSASYQLQGVIEQGKVSQAILKSADGQSIVLGLGDTLATWRLTQVLKQSAIFKQGTHADTLTLANQK